jgi:hypothetical protein
MNRIWIFRVVGFVTAVAMLAAVTSAGQAQQKSSPAAVKIAAEIVSLKGAVRIFDPLIAGVIEQGKNMYLQQNPAIQKDVNEIAAKLRTEFAPRKVEVLSEVARAYASHFSEAELKDILAFYKSPVGSKMIVEEPKALEQSMSFAQEWAIKFSDVVLARMREELKKMGHNF